MNKQERVYAGLRERILNGSCGPGYRLVIDAIANELGVSSLPVREAIRRLEAEGLVVYRPNIGAQVAPADPTQFEEILSGLALLEGYATALAAPELDAGDIAQLREIDERMDACLHHLDPIGFSTANREFHLVIHERCPNPYVRTLLQDTERRLDAIRRTVFASIPFRGRTSVQEHERIVELIEQRAPASRIESAARRHKLETLKAYRAWRDRSAAGAGAAAHDLATAPRS